MTDEAGIKTELGEDGLYEASVEVITLQPKQFSATVVQDEPVRHVNVSIDGKRPIWCREIDAKVTVEGVELTLHRYILKGEPDEDAYWVDA